MSTPIPSRLSFVGDIRPGRTIEARWIAGHPMHSGLLVDDSGRRIPRNIIRQILVRVNGELVLDIEPGTGLSANPYFSFDLVVPAQGGVVSVEWRDDQDRSGRVQQPLLLAP